jgi:uncharacterized membrane protein YgcG
VVTGSLGIAFAQRGLPRQFTPDDVHSIVTTLQLARHPGIFLVRTPVFINGRVVGSQLHGTLPMKEVERLAESLNIRLDKNANVIAVFDPDDGDDSGGGDGGGGDGGGGDGGGGDGGDDHSGPGSHIPANGRDLSNRVDVLLRDIDINSYQFLR